MALLHMVWLKRREETPASEMATILDELHKLKGTVPGVLDVSAGENLTDRARGFTHGALITLENAAALETYAAHPAHHAVVTLIKAACCDSIVLDYETRD